MAQPLVEHGAVRKLSQRIVSGYETQLILRELALEALPDLCAEGFQQLREGLVRLNGVRAEKLDHSEDPAAGHDGKRKRPVQPGLLGRGCPAEPLLGCDVLTKSGSRFVHARPGRSTPLGADI